MPPPYSKLIIIANNVKNINIIRQNLRDDVTSIIVDPTEIEESIETKIAQSGATNLTDLAILFDNTKSYAPFIEYTADEHISMAVQRSQITPFTLTIEVPNISEPEIEPYNSSDTFQDIIPIDTNDISPLPYTPPAIDIGDTSTTFTIPNPNYAYKDIYIKSDLMTPDSQDNFKFFSIGFNSFLNKIKNSNLQLTKLDIISCNIKEHVQFNTLGLTANYHNGILGGDNWVLSTGNVNLIGLYFTSNITDYRYSLGGIAPPLVGSCYEISIPDHLYWLMTYATNIGAAPNLSSTFCLSADIDMTSYGFPSESIGKNSAITDRFIGILDGNGYTITIGGVIANFTGLFNYFGDGATSAIVQNINLVYTNTSYTLTPPLAGSDLYFGFLIAQHTGGQCINNTISFSTSGNPVTLVVNNNVAGAFIASIGGLVGIVQGLTIASSPTITNCTITSNVPITIQVYSQRGVCLGGVVGGVFILPAAASNLGIFGTSAIFTSITLQAVRIALISNPPILNTINVGGFLGYMINNIAGLGTDKIFVKNNIFNCGSLTINSNLSGGQPANNPIFTYTAGGFIGVIERIVSVDTNTVNINSFVFEQTLYPNVSSATIGGAGSNSISPEIKNITISIGSSIYNININFGGFFSTFTGGILGRMGNSSLNPFTLENIIYDEDSMEYNFNTTVLPPTSISGTIGGAIGAINFTSSFAELANINNIIYTCNSIKMSTFIISPSVTFGGFLGGMINNAGTLSGCTVNINSITYLRTGVTSASTGLLIFGGLIGQGRTSISSSNVNIGNISITADMLNNIIIGGIIGALQNPSLIGTSVIIQNNTFNINSIITALTATATLSVRNIFIGGFIAEFNASTNTLSRNILNNTVNIQNMQHTLSRTTAINPGGFGYLFGGLFGRAVSAGTLPNLFAPIVITNLTANLGTVSFTTTQNEGTISTSAIIGSGANMNFNMSNSTITYSSLIINCIGSNAGNLLFGGINSDQSRGIFNLNTINIGVLSVILKSSVSAIGIGLLSFNPSISLFICTNNLINIGPNSYFESSTTTTLLALKYIGLLLAFTSVTGYNNNIITNNTVILQSSITMKSSNGLCYFAPINFLSSGVTVTNLTNNVYIKNTNYPLVFNTLPLPNIFPATTVVVDGVGYTLLAIPNTIQAPTGYSLTYSQFTLIFFFEEIVPQPVITCCTANICGANPQTANHDSSTAIQSQSGQQLVSAVNDFYAAAARGQARPNAPPIFKTYGQMMEWKQRQNRR